MKLRIVSDGSNSGTKVLDEFGNRIENIVAVHWSMKVGELSAATIEIRNVEIETGVHLPKKEKAYRYRKRFIRCLGDDIVLEGENL